MPFSSRQAAMVPRCAKMCQVSLKCGSVPSGCGVVRHVPQRNAVQQQWNPWRNPSHRRCRSRGSGTFASLVTSALKEGLCDYVLQMSHWRSVGWNLQNGLFGFSFNFLSRDDVWIYKRKKLHVKLCLLAGDPGDFPALVDLCSKLASGMEFRTGFQPMTFHKWNIGVKWCKWYSHVSPV